MMGIIAKKEGMTQFFNEEGNLIPVTIFKIDKNVVVNKRLNDKDGYSAVILGLSDLKDKKVTKPLKGQFKENLTPKRIIKEFRIQNPEEFEIGQEIGVEYFNDIQFVDVIGKSKGKGFQGVMKRHGFHGGRKTHGSKFHRQNGSTGLAAWPSKVFKGMKRAGRMGNDKVTVQNLKVINVDSENNVLVVKGCVPGNNKGIVFIRKALKKTK